MKSLQIIHCKIRPHKCDKCESTFTEARHLNKHQSSVHSGVTRFSCSTCDYSTFYKSRLKKHLLTHSGENPYKCNICEYACKEASNLKRHQLIHSKVRPHKCDECESAFSRVDVLKEHQLSVHRGVTKFKCSTCGYVTFYKSSLKRHLLVHTGENPYKCNICEYSCKEVGNLKRHQLVHGKVRFTPRLHKCDECELTFTQASYLKSHQLAVRKGVTRFSCPICDYVTFYKEKVKRHFLTHNVQNLHSCMDCNYYTESLNTLHVHLWHHIVTQNRSGIDVKFPQAVAVCLQRGAQTRSS